MYVLSYILLTLASTIVVWIGSGILEGSSEKLAVHYDLPPIIQGAVIAAVGSSFPELSSVVISTLLHGEFELGVAVIIGSAIFNILVIPGISGLVVRNPLKSNRDLVYKEALFYMLAIAILLLTFSFAVIYNPVQETGGKMTRILVLAPLLLYLLYIFIQYQDKMDYQPEMESSVNPWKQWGLLLFSLGVIMAGVEGLVRSAIGLGDLLNTPSFLWGVTIIAIATSISDTFVSVRAARSGKAVVSIANVLGSNTFDLLVVLPVGVLIAGSAVIDFSVAAPLMGFLVLATIVLFIFIRTSLEISRLESYLLLGIYGLFIFWMLLETVGISSLIF
ncbi:MAG: sodium:calcium antiporter [Thermodesulfobacteriota bacterium]